MRLVKKWYVREKINQLALNTPNDRKGLKAPVLSCKMSDC